MTKIYPNDLCPCGSGKKYKKCCGIKKSLKDYDLKRTNLHLEDFVISKISEDITFLIDAVQIILGPIGYSFCKQNAKEIEKEYQNDNLLGFVKKDKLNFYGMNAESDKELILKVRPYSGEIIEEQNDILSLLKKEYICVEGRQVELFHAYLMENLRNRFAEYLYVPDEKAVSEQEFGFFAHRGYDFLLGMTLYLELQLGIHIYLGLVNVVDDECFNNFVEYFELKEFYNFKEIRKNNNFLFDGLSLFMLEYAQIIETISKQYNANEEVELYNWLGAYDEEEYKHRKAIIQPGFYKPYPLFCDYIAYLRCVVSATCLSDDRLYMVGVCSFPQCDFFKYLCGIESIVELFEDKIRTREVVPKNLYDMELVTKYEKNHNIKFNKEDHVFERKHFYDTSVFWMMDELNGVCNHLKPVKLEYIDYADINDDDYTLKDGIRNINPARKSTRVYATRKLRMELYNILNGKFITLFLGKNNADNKNKKAVAKYPILPWLSNGVEPTTHCKPFDRHQKSFDELFSPDVGIRQYFLSMEYRLTSIPVNCVEEFLIPDVFHSWDERNELLKETQRQNESLKRHIQLNQELVRNLSHSSANYLNANRLAQTGVELHNAENNNPTLDDLHMRGLSLLLQSEQEMFLSRQLNGLVWRCSADINSLSQQIRDGLSKTEGSGVLSAVDFSLKVVLARILFRENDNRASFIMEKLNKSDEAITKIKSSFMLDLLSDDGDEQEGKVVEWWNEYIGKINIKTTKVWDSLHILKNKSFYDLIIEIVTEQILNALSHGDLNDEIVISFGQADEYKGYPRWAFISCVNRVGLKYSGGREVGITTLDETMKLLNSNKKGLEIIKSGKIFENKAWLLSGLLRAL